jgi:hypothetical protein
MTTSVSKHTCIEHKRLTLYLFLRSEERAALIRMRLTLEGALKCAFRDLRLELLTPASMIIPINNRFTRGRSDTSETRIPKNLGRVRDMLCNTHIRLSKP